MIQGVLEGKQFVLETRMNSRRLQKNYRRHEPTGITHSTARNEAAPSGGLPVKLRHRIALTCLACAALLSSFQALAQFSQQGPKLVGTDTVGHAIQGWSVSLSADGNTVIIGGFHDNNNTGAAWVWTRSGGVWTQQRTKLVGSGVSGSDRQSYSVSLSVDGNTAIVGGFLVR